jgi:Ulp1 family protease
MWWKEKHVDGCCVHCFTTHFCTQLLDNGPMGVARWTAKKHLDVFTKKFLFIPVNKCGEHWSLCVVINPGAIRKNVKSRNVKPANEDAYPCILFFDSLGWRVVVDHACTAIRAWLNSEWKRLNKEEQEDLFTPESLNVYFPTGEQHYLFLASSPPP